MNVLKLNMGVTLIDLISSCLNNSDSSVIWDKIEPYFEKHYPEQLDQKNNYINVIETLLTLVPIVDHTTCIYFMEHDGDDITVHLKDSIESFSTLGTPWNVFLGYKIDDPTLEKYCKEQIIAHCLWEITFLGFDEKKINHRMSKWERKS